MELSVSILNSKDKIEMIKRLNNTNISYIHLDVMDGNFVSQIALPPKEIVPLAKVSDKKLDIHLMVENPLEYLEEIKKLSSVAYVTIHLEINKNLPEIIRTIKSSGFKVGLSIKPTTPIDKLNPYLKDIDLVLLMTVEPGLGGQPFLPVSTIRLKELKKILPSTVKIEVDGGINDETISQVSLADIAVVGSYITKSQSPEEKINSLLV